MSVNLHLQRKKNEPAEKLIRRFFRKLDKLKIIQRYKETTAYEKPSIKKRRKKKQQELKYASGKWK